MARPATVAPFLLRSVLVGGRPTILHSDGRVFRAGGRSALSGDRGGRLAQLVERQFYTLDVGGSRPSPPTISNDQHIRGLGSAGPIGLLMGSHSGRALANKRAASCHVDAWDFLRRSWPDGDGAWGRPKAVHLSDLR